MERSAIRGGLDASRQSRITLRSSPGYGALHPPLQGEGRPPQAGGVGCSAPPLARAPVDAVTPPAALRASTSPSRGGGRYRRRRRQSKRSPDEQATSGEHLSARISLRSCGLATGNEFYSSEIRFVPFGHGRPRKFNGSHTRNARFSVVYGRASAQFRCCLTRLSASANRRSIPPTVRGRQPVTPTDGAGAVPAGGGSSLPLPGGPGIDPAGITTGARGASLKRDAKAQVTPRTASREARPGSSFGTWPEQEPR